MTIPGMDKLIIKHLVCDVNGTLALDGVLLPGVAERIQSLKKLLEIHLITANTNGKQSEIDEVLGTKAILLAPGAEAGQKAAYLRSLGAKQCAAIGQGANDQGMLKEAALGICVLSPEGTYGLTLLSADIVFSDILTALDLFEHPNRMIATLRQ